MTSAALAHEEAWTEYRGYQYRARALLFPDCVGFTATVDIGAPFPKILIDRSGEYFTSVYSAEAAAREYIDRFGYGRYSDVKHYAVL